MNTESCSCTDPKFPNLGRPNCVIRKKKTAVLGIRARYNEAGERNVIDASSATLGDDIRALIQTTTPALERLYLTPKFEEVTWDRSASAYQTMKSGKRFRLDGEGGVRTFNGMLAGDDGVEQMARELQKLGCTEFDVIEITTDGNIWGVMDDTAVADVRGYAVDKETFDAFIQRAVDGAINGVMIQFDLEDDADLVNSYAITTTEMGYRATTLRGLISAVCTAVEATSTTLIATITTGYGTAANPGKVVGLTTSNFTVTADGTPVTVTAAETADGVYTLTFADLDISSADEVVVAVSATGYDVASGTFTAS